MNKIEIILNKFRVHASQTEEKRTKIRFQMVPKFLKINK